MSEIRSFQIVSSCSTKKEDYYVSSLDQLVRSVRGKFGLIGDVKIVLESDGTIVDDEDYFATLEPNTCLMVLKSDESWSAPTSRCTVKDEVDFVRPDVGRLLRRLKGDTSQLMMLSDKDLELLSDINPETLDFQDKNFLRDIKKACNLYLNDRREAKDCIELMKLYHQVTK